MNTRRYNLRAFAFGFGWPGCSEREKCRWLHLIVLASLIVLPACKTQQPTRPTPHPQPTPIAASTPAPPPATTPAPALNLPTPSTPSAPKLKDLFPHIRIDAVSKLIEFDGIISVDAHNEHTPIVNLEWLVCSPDSKEHESLVMTKAKPSHIHAALLLLGLNNGKPGTWNWEGKQLTATPPTGDRLTITVRLSQPDNIPSPSEVPLTDWVATLKDERPFMQQFAEDYFVFSGSNMVHRNGQEWYQADREGGVIGLTCFSNELISWSRMFSPDSGVQEPLWIANAKRVPRFQSPVIITVRRW